jgi:hypothetical protein
MYSMNALSFFAYVYLKYAEFHAGFKSMKIFEKSAPRKSFFAKNFCKLVLVV